MACAVAHAIVIGGSNLDLFGYPEAMCSKPDPPVQPFSPSSRFEIDMYNLQVDRYNMELEQFINCTKRYLDNAKNDIQRIRERMDGAVERARR